MNLIKGKLLDKEQSLIELEKLHENITQVKQKEGLERQTVISACQSLSESLSADEIIPLLLGLGIPEYKAQRELFLAKQMLSRQYLEKRLEIEFGSDGDYEYSPIDVEFKVKHICKPLGVLLHIVAGNVDALPVFSVIEGLLTGNINILKLPGEDNGLSVSILKRLIEIEPLLADYIYVFDYPSQETESIQKMADSADAVIIWGGDEAVSSVRRMAKPDTKIIEWGHKISFAYVSGEATDVELSGIAFNICDTNQLFCSSCQGIYLDTDSCDEAAAFAERFLKILDKKAEEMPLEDDPYLRAQKTLEFYTEELEAVKTKKLVLRTKNCGVIAYDDCRLEPSYMFRHCWVKPLPRNKILAELGRYKNHLQTVGLVCGQSSRDELISLFSKTGIVRIARGENMSVNYCGMPHDGDFSLRRYMKVVAVDI